MISEIDVAIDSAQQTPRAARASLGMESGGPAASVLDLGSNSVKLSHYTVDAHNDFKLYYQRSARLKLFEGLQDGVMRSEYVDRIINTLLLFREKIDFEGVKYVVAVATSAIRDAKNRDDVIRRIAEETGFEFQVLSDRDEAHYSYAGAVRMLHVPTTLFFDIGGGSLEVVVAQNYAVQSAESFHLGALRLTRMFAKDDRYAKIDFDSMSKHINKTLPSAKQLHVDDLVPAKGDGKSKASVTVVGVGGALRTLAKYIQSKKQYPLSKTHNYKLTLDDLEDVWDTIRDMPPDKISKIQTISSQRADTIRAALLVIILFLKKLNLTDLTISAHGLREGALALSLQHSSAFRLQRIDPQHIRETVLSTTSPSSLLVSSKIDSLVDILLSVNLLRASDAPIIKYALEQTDRLRSFRDISNILPVIMDDDTPLSHGDQLFAALAVMHMRKRHKADAGLINFEAVAGPYDKKWVRRISAIISTYQILVRSSATITPSLGKGGSISMTVRIDNPATATIGFPTLMFEEVCGQLESAFGIPFEHSLVDI